MRHSSEGITVPEGFSGQALARGCLGGWLNKRMVAMPRIWEMNGGGDIRFQHTGEKLCSPVSNACFVTLREVCIDSELWYCLGYLRATPLLPRDAIHVDPVY